MQTTNPMGQEWEEGALSDRKHAKMCPRCYGNLIHAPERQVHECPHKHCTFQVSDEVHKAAEAKRSGAVSRNGNPSGTPSTPDDTHFCGDPWLTCGCSVPHVQVRREGRNYRYLVQQDGSGSWVVTDHLLEGVQVWRA